MQARSSLIAGLAVVVWSGALALAQTPTPTPISSQISVSSYAQNHGQSSMRHCSISTATLCNTNADCPPGSCVGDNSVECHTNADCAVCVDQVCANDGSSCTKNANCAAGGCSNTESFCTGPAAPYPCCTGNLTGTCTAETCPIDALPTPCTTVGGEGCGGCYPAPYISTLTSDLPLVDPEWQPIGPMISGGDPSPPPESNPVTIHGTVALSKINIGSDFPGSHIGDDQNTFIQLDAADNGFLATGNSSDYECVPVGENCGLIEMELEFNKYPLFAWAGEGDRITAVGRWIFDCGHADPEPLGGCSNSPTTPCITASDCGGTATCTNPEPTFNYRAELHPPHAIAVLRNKSVGSKPATQADIFVTADAGGAGDICTVTHLASPSDVLFQKNCFLNHCSKTTSRSCATSADCASGEQCLTFDQSLGGPVVADINANDFAFDMPLPTPPADVTSPTLKTSFKSFKPKGGIMPPKPILSTPTPGMLHVVVPMTTPASKKAPNNVFAGRLLASWKEDTTKLTHVQVKFLSLTINNPLKRATPVLNQLCTNPGGGLSTTPCSGNSDCSPGTCTKMGGTPTTKPCYTDKDCSKTQYCGNYPSVCVGGIPPGWVLFSEVNGDWVQLAGSSKPDPLTTIGVADPFSSPPYTVPPTPLIVPLKKNTFDEYVPSNGGEIRIANTGDSLGCVDLNLYGRNLKQSLYTYGLISGAACLDENDPDPGRLDVTHTGPNFTTSGVSGATCVPPAKGTLYTCTATPTGGDGGTCSGATTQLCVEDKDCPPSQTCQSSPAWALTYTIQVK